jgi:hypothetical protein
MYFTLSTNRSKEWKWNLGAHFIKVTPSLQQSFQWRTTCINVIINVSILNKNFVLMTNHLFKDPKWLINIHYFVDLMNISIGMKILTLQVDLHISHYQQVNLGTENENENWEPFYRGNSKFVTISTIK